MAKSKKKAPQTANNTSKKNGNERTAASPATVTRRAVEAKEETPSPERWSENDSRFWWAASLILVIGILLRQWKLADAPYHTDEAIHAMNGYNLLTYSYDPVYHGPLLYHLVAIVFRFNILGYGLGDNDFTARLVPSLLGIGVLALVIGPGRKFLGTKAALWSTVLLAISPVMVSYSRRLLHDSLVAALTLGAVLCFQTARENPSHTPAGRQARIGVAVLLTLFLATKANAFFIIAMLAAYWILLLLSGEDGEGNKRVELTGPVWDVLPSWLPVAAAFFVTGVSIFAVRDPEVLARNESILKLASVFSCFIVWEFLRRRPAAAIETIAPQRSRQPPSSGEVPAAAGTSEPRPAFDWVTPLMAVGISALIFTFLFGHGVKGLQMSQPFSESLHEAWGSPPLFGSSEAPGAIRRMLSYWSGQQGKPRLPGRHDYYLVLMALYELPILIASVGGLIYASRKRTKFTDLLIWWAFTSWVVYAMANEKVPWLMTHMVLPMALLGGVWLASLRPRSSSARAAFAFACVAGGAYLLRGVSATNFERAADNHEPMFYAQSTEKFRDDLFAGLAKTASQPGDVWVYPEKQWPMSWYLRDSKRRLGFDTQWGNIPQYDKVLKLAVHMNERDWKSHVDSSKVSVQDYRATQNIIGAWPGTEADFFIWPRASWPALQPGRWAKWWWNRDATMENGVLSEWSNSPAVVSVRP